MIVTAITACKRTTTIISIKSVRALWHYCPLLVAGTIPITIPRPATLRMHIIITFYIYTAAFFVEGSTTATFVWTVERRITTICCIITITGRIFRWPACVIWIRARTTSRLPAILFIIWICIFNCRTTVRRPILIILPIAHILGTALAFYVTICRIGLSKNCTAVCSASAWTVWTRADRNIQI